MLADKPYSESCDQNKLPILEVLREVLSPRDSVLEIGSGTGQHAVYFASQLPGLSWQPSDRGENLPGIRAWMADAGQSNVREPLELDVLRGAWPDLTVQAVFSANTAHIMSWPAVAAMFQGVGECLDGAGRFCLYGPFSYGGHHTSPSNASFDQWLKARDPQSGVRDFDDLDRLAGKAGMELQQDYEMPVNNRILVWRRRIEG